MEAHSKCKKEPAMKKNSNRPQVERAAGGAKADHDRPGLGDKTSRYCVVGDTGSDVGRQRGDDPESGGDRVYRDGAVPDRHGSGDAFAVVEPDADSVWVLR